MDDVIIYYSIDVNNSCVIQHCRFIVSREKSEIKYLSVVLYRKLMIILQSVVHLETRFIKGGVSKYHKGNIRTRGATDWSAIRQCRPC